VRLLSCAGGLSVKPLMSCDAASEESGSRSVRRDLLPDLGIVDLHDALLDELPRGLPAVRYHGVGVGAEALEDASPLRADARVAVLPVGGDGDQHRAVAAAVGGIGLSL